MDIQIQEGFPMSQQILPFYLVCDESGSMTGEPIDAINKSIPELHQEIGSNPVVADKTRFCLIAFSHKADVLLPLSDLGQVSSVPALSAHGGTSYGAAFDLLYQTIADDVAKLKSQGHKIFRPTVFFLSDGQPGDNWASSHQRLTDPGWTPHPNILAFGIGTVHEDTIRQVATVRAFIGNGSLSPGPALREFAQSLIRSIVNSGTQSAADPSGAAKLVMPDNVPGFTTLSADPIT
jgi:uncharacterized protein YegL